MATIENYIVTRIEALEQENAMLTSENKSKDEIIDGLAEDIAFIIGLFKSETRGENKVVSSATYYEAYEPEEYAKLVKLMEKYADA